MVGMTPRASPVDQITTDLHERGWSYGYTRDKTPHGLLWVADAHKGDQKCIAKGPTLEEALTELLKLVEGAEHG